MLPRHNNYADKQLTSCNSLPAAASRAESGFGEMRRHLMTSKICSIPYFEDQSFFNVETQISPLECMFG
jgi:hypothetical protein